MMIIAACPENWECKPEFSKCYYYITEDLTWIGNNERCMELDPEATLTSVDSQSENYYIRSLLVNGDYTGIGGTDMDEEGVWRWVNLGMFELVEFGPNVCGVLPPHLSTLF